MFDQLKNLKQIASLMGNASELRQKIEQVQQKLARKQVEAEAGAGAVRVAANGKMEIVSVHLDAAMLTTLSGEGAEADQQMIEELIAAATNAALAKARELIKQELSSAAGGMDIGGLDQLINS